MGTEKNKKISLEVKKGVEKPSSLSPYVSIKKAEKWSVDEMFSKLRQGDRSGLARAITLTESTLVEHQNVSRQLIEKCLPYSGNSLRIGITGVPGAGKSTFIEALGTHILEEGNKLAVLAIDPSSQLSKGSILGDKTRMEKLSVHPQAFIRPSPSSGTLGGIAAKTREVILLCEAAGYNIIFVETVGVGQSEVSVHQMVDFFMLLAIAGAGDELQGIKRGIMELADAVVINKADGENINKVQLAKNHFEQALHLFPPSISGWTIPVKTCSSLYGEGIEDIWKMIDEYFSFIKKNSYFKKHRKQQQYNTFDSMIAEQLKEHFYLSPAITNKIKYIRQQIEDEKVSIQEGVKEVIGYYFDSL